MLGELFDADFGRDVFTLGVSLSLAPLDPSLTAF